MNEHREAEALARWLDSRGGELPEEVGDDVLAAALALRPDLAPPPRVSIDDVLGEVLEGPLARDEGEGARLAGWLDEDGIPEDADDEALEAIFALRPDLAGAPRVSIDDVLAGVASGPLSERASASPEPTLPASLGELPEAVVVANNVPGARRRLPGWFIPGMSALLVAALALVVVVPMSAQLRSSPSAIFAEAPAPESAPAPPPMPMAEVASPSPDTPTQPMAPPATTPATEPAFAARGGAGLDAAPIPGDGDAERAAVTGADVLAAAERPAEEKQEEGVKDAPATELYQKSVTELDWGATGGATASGTTPQAAPPAPSEYARDEDDADAAGPVIAEAEEVEATVTVSKRSTSSRETRESAKPKAAAAPAMPTTTSTATASADSWSASADRRRQADAALARGDTDTAEAFLSVLTRDPDPSVAAQAALDLGRLLLDQGRESEALAVVQRALGLANVPHALNVKLRALQAEIAQ